MPRLLWGFSSGSQEAEERMKEGWCLRKNAVEENLRQELGQGSETNAHERKTASFGMGTIVPKIPAVFAASII